MKADDRTDLHQCYPITRLPDSTTPLSYFSRMICGVRTLPKTARRRIPETMVTGRTTMRTLPDFSPI